MNQYRRLELGSLVKLVVDSKGITNGSIDILSFEYDINSEIEKIVEYVENNDFPELQNEVQDIKLQNDILENKIKDYALQILTLQNDTELLNNIIQEYNSVISSQYNNLILITNQILNKIKPSEPIIIVKEKIVIQKNYTEVQTVKYRGVKSISEVKDEVVVIDRGTSRPRYKADWYEYSDEWEVYTNFEGKEVLFRRKDTPLFGLYPAKLFHKIYDK